jgi:membrane protein required for colicin V production
MLGLLNKLAGAVFGTLKVAVILGAVLIFFERANNNAGLVSDEVKNTSLLYHPVKDIGELVFDNILREDTHKPAENR